MSGRGALILPFIPRVSHFFSSLFKLVPCLLLVTTCFLPRSASGYALENAFWASGSTITVQLSLGSTAVQLQDGLQTWNNSAADALALWNAELATIQFDWVVNSSAPKASGDGINSVFFDSSIFGDDFGEDVLAVTLSLTDDHALMAEGDVIVNNAYNFNSYRGPLQGTLYDIHRLFLHEFGHVIGLGHPDGPSNQQMVTAIMNSFIGDLDHLATDDIDGASLRYGLKITNSDPLTLRVGDPLDYQVLTNVPAGTYLAVGLPPGMVLDSKTGVITGAATLSDVYDVDITIDGPGSPYTRQFIFVVQPNPAGDLRASFTFGVNRLLLDPVRARVYASLSESNGIAVIDSTTVSLLATIPLNGTPQGMAISPDGTKLYVAETSEVNPEIGVVNLDALTALPSLPAPAACVDIEAGASNRLYVTTATNDLSTSLFQLDATTGALLAPFPSGIPTGYLEISADRTRLYLATADNESHSLYLFDSGLASPLILQTAPNRGSLFRDLKLSHDGSFFCFADVGGVNIPKVPAIDITGTLAVFSKAGPAWAAIAFSPDDQLFFKNGTDYFFSQIDTYDVTTAQFVRSLQGEYYLNPSDMVVDSSGQYLFVSSIGPPALQVLGTGVGSPAHPPKAKRLLNVSTRLKAGTGDDVLIGGFIISGSGSKQVAIRAIGPSLPVAGALADPVVTLYDQTGNLVKFSNNWNEDRPGVLFTGLAPADEHEAVVVTTLAPGAYTAVLQGAAGGAGVALVEIYDLTADGDSNLANISTRGKVETGDNVMIGGFIISPEIVTKVMVRAIGPTLTQFGVGGSLQDPVLELHSGDGDLIFTNDNWRSTQQADILATGLAPTDDRESAIIATLQPGNYTAIVRGQNSTSGVALVEIYNLDSAAAVK